jgi:myotubularin-related protein 1/2
MTFYTDTDYTFAIDLRLGQEKTVFFLFFFFMQIGISDWQRVHRDSLLGTKVSWAVSKLREKYIADASDDDAYALFVEKCDDDDGDDCWMALNENRALSGYTLMRGDKLWLQKYTRIDSNHVEFLAPNSPAASSISVKSKRFCASLLVYSRWLLCPEHCVEQAVIKGRVRSVSDLSRWLATRHRLSSLSQRFEFDRRRSALPICDGDDVDNSLKLVDSVLPSMRRRGGESRCTPLVFRSARIDSDPAVVLGPRGRVVRVLVARKRRWKTLYFDRETTVRSALCALSGDDCANARCRSALWMCCGDGDDDPLGMAGLFTLQCESRWHQMIPDHELLWSFDLASIAYIVVLARSDDDGGGSGGGGGGEQVEQDAAQHSAPWQRRFIVLIADERSYETVTLGSEQRVGDAVRAVWQAHSALHGAARCNLGASDDMYTLMARSDVTLTWLDRGSALGSYTACLASVDVLELRRLPGSRAMVVVDGVDCCVHVQLPLASKRVESSDDNDESALFDDDDDNDDESMRSVTLMHDASLKVSQAEIVLLHAVDRYLAHDKEAGLYGFYLKTMALADKMNDSSSSSSPPPSLSSSSPDSNNVVLRDIKPASPSPSPMLMRRPLDDESVEKQASASSSSAAPQLRFSAGPSSDDNEDTSAQLDDALASSSTTSDDGGRAVGKIWLMGERRLSSYAIDARIGDVVKFKQKPTMARLKEMMEAFSNLIERPELLTSEKVELKDDHVIVPGHRGHQTLGTLMLTNYRLIFMPHSRSTYEDVAAQNMPNVSIPFTTMRRVGEIGGGGGRTRGIEIICKDFRQLLFGFGYQSNKSRCSTFCKLIKRNAFPIHRLGLAKGAERLFAFASGEHFAECIEYDALREYERLGLGGAGGEWRIVDNSDFRLSPSYPSRFVVPASVSAAELRTIADYRSSRRVPAVCWRHTNGATLTRCSQPGTGLVMSRCAADEKLVRALIAASPNSDTLYIVDLRPVAVAVGHTVLGAGSENVTKYDGCKIKFMNIAGIHHMTDSCKKLYNACVFDIDASNWYAQLSSTQWLAHISLLLNAATAIVEIVERQGTSTVVHCSDGWDRTPQVCSLVELLVDPHYRSIAGFAQLIEKEWLSFGHQFALRCGHGDKPRAQNAPIFLQFLDAVWQVAQQHPAAFEFNQDFLIACFDHVHSCRFGTFLFNAERERSQARVTQRTVSVWNYFVHHRDRFTNPFYAMAEDDSSNIISSSGGARRIAVLPIVSSVSNLRLWRACYMRWNAGYFPSLNVEQAYADALAKLKRQQLK